MLHESKVLTGMHTSHVLPDRSVMMSSGRKAIESTYVCVCVCVCVCVHTFHHVYGMQALSLDTRTYTQAISKLSSQPMFVHTCSICITHVHGFEYTYAYSYPRGHYMYCIWARTKPLYRVLGETEHRAQTCLGAAYVFMKFVTVVGHNGSNYIQHSGSE